MRLSAVLIGLLSLQATIPLMAEETPSAAPTETPEHKAQRLAWFREARFGMFIHWGVYAVPAGTYKDKQIGGIGEWIMEKGQIPVAEYKAFAKDFTASKYDPEKWAALAKRAGMRYVVITSKHHDGLTLFDSAASDWNTVKASAAKRDLIAPLEKAVRGQGLRFGLYYSQAQDWTNPGGGAYKKKWDPAQEGDYDQYLTKVAVPQVEELLAKFRPDLVWWDTPAQMTPARAAYFAPVLAKYPDLVMNNRLGGGVKGDCETPEQHIPPRGFPGRDFEVCMTMNDTWGFKSYDNKWKPVRQIIQHLSDIASKGGNFLLNVGPTAEGEIPVASIERLEAVGKWMDVYGNAIHGSQASPFIRRLTWGRVTRKADADGVGETLFLHVWDWPKNGKLVLPQAGQAGTTAELMAGKVAVPTAQQGSDLELTVPATAPDADVSVIALHLPKAVVDGRSAMPEADKDGVVHLKVHDADSIGSYSGNMAIVGSGDAAYYGPWTDGGWKLEYRLKSAKAQTWLVQAEIATADAVKAELVVGKTVIPAPIAATGGADAWKTIDLGKIQLPAGETSFTIRPDKKDWKPIVIRTVTLRPAP